MQLYKLNLPNGIVNNIIEYNCDDEECDYCYTWGGNKEMFRIACKGNILDKKKPLKKIY